MKRFAFIALLFASLALNAQTSVERWDCFETSITAKVKGNPFDVKLCAVFTNGTDRISVNGFYDGDDTFRIRFMPQEEGVWTYVTSSNVPALNRRKGSFECVAPGKDNHGPVVADGLHFKYSDGTRYYPVGTTSYDWMHCPFEGYQAKTIASLKASGFNKIRSLFFLHNLQVEYAEDYAPFERNADGSWDYDRFNPAYFRHVEDCINALKGIGVESDLILFHPYDGGRWGFDRMPLEVNLRYLKYVTARMSALRNIWWSLANEFDAVKGIPAEDWDKFAACVEANDPYHHLVSIHGLTASYYDYTEPVFTHTSIQDHAPVMESGRAFTIRNIYKKPVVFDEVCYEGNQTSRWGWLSGQEMLRRMYNGLMSGCYVTHAECFNTGDHEDGTNYLAFGGDFHGESWKRIRFMREILEGLPGPLGLADSSWDPYTATTENGCYLIYFGNEIRESWTFDLPTKNAKAAKLGEGVEFKVEVIDTWNMTVTEWPETFVTAAPGRYRVTDRNGSAIRLPATPYLMLRITRI